jgi:hypothetical protein
MGLGEGKVYGHLSHWGGLQTTLHLLTLFQCCIHFARCLLFPSQMGYLKMTTQIHRATKWRGWIPTQCLTSKPDVPSSALLLTLGCVIQTLSIKSCPGVYTYVMHSIHSTEHWHSMGQDLENNIKIVVICCHLYPWQQWFLLILILKL